MFAVRRLVSPAIIATVVITVACGAAPPPVAPAPAPAAAKTSAAADRCEDDGPYQKLEPARGPAPNLPPVPELPGAPHKIGADYTVHGAVYALNSRYHGAEVAGDITIVGVIVATNLDSAPKCAVHRTGRRDPDGCQAEVPSFTIADDAQSQHRIQVLGWASSFATVFEAELKYKALRGAPLATPLRDDLWGSDVPYPLPSTGAKVRVRGRYGFTFSKSSRGLVIDPQNGVFTLLSVETLEPSKTPAKLGR